MNAAKRTVKRKKAIDTGMKKPLIYSALLHICVIILATVGLPYIISEQDLQEMAITVELAELAPVSETNVVDKPNETEKPENAPPKPLEAKPVYKQEDATEPEPEKPDDLLTPRKPEVEEVPEPPEEKLPEPEKKEELKPPPKPTNKPKPPKPPKPKEEKPKEEPKKEDESKVQQEDFTSLLKTLAPQEDAQKPVQAPPQETTEESQISQLAQMGKTLTRGEEDDLNRGVQPCWNVNAGGKYAEELIVSLLVSINPDMSVKDVRVIDEIRYSSDAHYRAAADAARRALLNPTCRTLKLPPEKYESWKVFKYNFDPSAML